MSGTRRITGRLALGSITLMIAGLIPSPLKAGDEPYFVTYDDQLEEQGNLEISLNPMLGLPGKGKGPVFMGSWVEFEYGAKGWWTTEFYLDGQSTRGDSTIFTGFRWENRFRPLAGQHWINPVIYVEYESLNGADKILKEIVNHDGVEDLAASNAEGRSEHKHEVEGKLILSSNYRGWNISENLIGEKNLANEPWEFGYAVGVGRPLALAASPRLCTFCRENWRAGVEVYGGLGTWHEFGFAGTAHYLAPVVAWDFPTGATLRFSPGFGLNKNSARALIRFGISYEIPRFDRRIRKWLR